MDAPAPADFELNAAELEAIHAARLALHRAGRRISAVPRLTPMRSYDHGRVDAVIEAAADALFAVLNNASSHLRDRGAAQTIKAWYALTPEELNADQAELAGELAPEPAADPLQRRADAIAAADRGEDANAAAAFATPYVVCARCGHNVTVPAPLDGCELCGAMSIELHYFAELEAADDYSAEVNEARLAGQ